jgi:hypothetical protein
VFLSGSGDCKDGREQSQYIRHFKGLRMIAKMDFATSALFAAIAAPNTAKRRQP